MTVIKRVAKYIRVSTDMQDFSRQEDGLNEFIGRNPNWTTFGCFDDVKSGKSDQREGFRKMMNLARANQFQVLVVWDLDRFARSLTDLIKNCEELMRGGVEIYFVNQNIRMDKTPESQFTFHILGAAAQFERNLISRRTKEGMASAKARGVKFGVPLKLGKKRQEEFKQMWNDGKKVGVIAKYFGISYSTVKRYRRSLDLEKRGKPNLVPKRPEWTKHLLKNRRNKIHTYGIENANEWDQKRADVFWADRKRKR